MNQTATIYSLLGLFLLFWIYQNYETIRINVICWIIINRGILTPNRFWWAISDLFLTDGSGINIYNRLRKKYKLKIVSVNILGTPVNVVIDNEYIRKILDNSPRIFGVGKLKKAFFKSFMSKNVGVSEGYSWMRRRKMNEQVLDTDCVHRYANIYHDQIGHIIQNCNTDRSIDFISMGKKITAKIVFGEEDVESEIFEVFNQANSIIAVLNASGVDLTKSHEFKIYQKYLTKHIKNPKQYSLIDIAVCHEDNYQELMHQIPHWIFPIVGQYLNSLPRMLLLLQHYPSICSKVEQELNQCQGHGKDIYKLSYLRWCLLETFRLHNPVVTTFRTLLQDYCFKDVYVPYGEQDSYVYRKGDNFLILNNPVLRDTDFWVDPNCFIPERWNDEKIEDSYYAIMFNQGPQRCPGKELILFILQSTLYHLYQKLGRTLRFTEYSPKLDVSNIPQMTNPFAIRFS